MVKVDAAVIVMSLFDFTKFEDPQWEIEPRPEDTTPEFEGTVIPEWVPPLCDVYTEAAIYVWHHVVDDAIDVRIEECGHTSIGRIPEWRHYDDYSITEVISLDYHDMRWLSWAIEQGVSPGQPFLLQINKPVYTQDYYGECDVEWEWDFLRALPCHPKKAAQAWDKVIQSITGYAKARDVEREKLRLLRLSDTSAFCLRFDNYWPSMYGYDEMTPPRGIRVHLCSKHSQLPKPGEKLPTWGAAYLVSGEDDDGSYQVAFERLLENVKQLSIDPEVVRLIKDRVWC